MYIGMYITLCIYADICVGSQTVRFVCMYYLSIYVCMYLCMYACIYACIYIYVCIRMYVCEHVCITYVCMYVYTYIYHTHKHNVCMYVCIYIYHTHKHKHTHTIYIYRYLGMMTGIAASSAGSIADTHVRIRTISPAATYMHAYIHTYIHTRTHTHYEPRCYRTHHLYLIEPEVT
jgi:hypothetical protein